MPRMPATVAALQQGRVVRPLRLVQLEFASETKRLHQGFGRLRTSDGQIWSGLGKLGQISDIDRAVVPSGAPVTLTLSGVDPGLIGKTLAAASEVKGRPVLIFDQHFNADLGLLDGKIPVLTALMDEVSIQDSGATATITVSTVTLLYNRRRPAFAYLSAASQRRLYPNDGGANQMPRLVQSVEKWPSY